MYKKLKKIQRENILNDNLVVVIILLSLPLVFNSLISSIYNIVDAIFVSNIGSIEVASIVFVGSIDNFFKGIPMGIAAGATTLVARHIGSGEYHSAKKYAGNAITITVILALILSFISIFYSKNILILFDATENILNTSNLYFKINMLISVILFFNLIYLGIKSAEGNTKKAMQINCIPIVIKIILNYTFIFIFKGGLLSLSLSTFLAGLIVTIYGVYDLFFSSSSFKLTINELQLDNKILKLLLLISTPIILERMSISFGFTAINSQVLLYGEDVLAAYGITNRINSVSFAAVTAVGTGMSIVISQNLSYGNVDRCREAIRKTFIINIIFSTSLFFISFIFRDYLAGMFTYGKNSNTFEHTINALSTYAVSVIPWAIFQVVMGMFKGTGETKFNLYISLGRIYLLRLPLVWIFVNYFAYLSEYSVWYSVLFSNIITAVISVILYKKKNKRLILYTLE